MGRAGPDLSTAVGSVRLGAPVMTASGTAGHGAELSAYGALGSLGAVVVKSLAAYPWTGNPGRRVHAVAGGSMLNAVGLQGPGVAAWRETELPHLLAAGAVVVASIWGRSVEDYAAAAGALAGAPGVVALEVNVSCPNVEDRSRMFAHSPQATAAALEASVAAADGLPCWAKLSPNVPDVCEIAGAALGAGAEGLTLVNTLLGMVVDPEGRRPPMAGGLSGTAVHPVAVRAVLECRTAFPSAGIVGVGGVATGADAAELLAAGADAVQVGTATFADPRAPWRVQDDSAGGAGDGASGCVRWSVRPFGERVAVAVAATGPLCVGIDPSAALLGAWGLADDPGGLRSLCGGCVEQLAGVVPVVKPQVAFFERHGSAGMAVLETLLAEARAAGLLVIADAKRGDIDSTVAAYAEAWLDGPFAADAVTASPYLGFAALAPMVSAARRTGRGVLVVVASSNPEGRPIQEAVGPDGRSVEQALLDQVAAANRTEAAAIGSVGAVVGATRVPPFPLGEVGGVILAPGVGAQGATPADVAERFAGCAPGTVLPSASRAVLGAGLRGLRAAATRLRDELVAATA